MVAIGGCGGDLKDACIQWGRNGQIKKVIGNAWGGVPITFV